jgi:ribosomal protein L11 methyltransferase
MVTGGDIAHPWAGAPQPPAPVPVPWPVARPVLCRLPGTVTGAVTVTVTHTVTGAAVAYAFPAMPTYSLTLHCPPELAEIRSAELWELDATGVELRDGEIKPMPGEAPPAGSAVLVGFFGAREAAEDAAAALGGGRVEEIPDQDWGETWKKGLGPIAVGRVFVRPSWVVAEVPAGSVEVVLDPGMAFGTGSHQTTSLCLGALSEVLTQRPGATVLDVGTGSGLLAIAARKLGAGRTVANDNDPVAVDVARENAARNGVEIAVVGDALPEIGDRFDVVVANILANTLVELAPDLAAHLRPSGVTFVSGILFPQEPEVRAAYQAAGLVPLPARDRRDGEWSLLAFGQGAA